VITELLCVGNAMVDVFAQADRSAMDRLGVTEPVQHISSEKAEWILRELRNNSAGGGAEAGFTVTSGGGAANVAKIAALLGIKSGFLGRVGEDPRAGVFKQELLDAGAVPILFQGKEKTGVCILLSDSRGETRIAAAPGAALELTSDDITEESIQNSEAVALDGYVLDRQPLVRRILELADKHGVPVALDVASVFHVKEKAEQILHYGRNYPLILFMNEDETIAFYNSLRKTKEDYENRGEREKADWIIREICPVFKNITAGELFPIIAVKLGGRGAAIVAGGAVYRAETFTVVPRNNTGAGDAFCAAFLAGWIRHKSIIDCAGLGNTAAREILEVPGTRIGGQKLAHIAKTL
jgi:sugar/nucleoside kinase (ribokinase family)